MEIIVDSVIPGTIILSIPYYIFWGKSLPDRVFDFYQEKLDHDE